MEMLNTLLASSPFLWFGERVLRVIVVAVFARLTLRFGRVLIDKIFHPPDASGKGYFVEKKAKTLGALLKSILRYSVYFVSLLIILEMFQLPTASILTSAGILGLAVGFGAQNLVRDVITGFFLIFEDQFSVGDYIAAAGVEGVVEEIGFRTTKIRDFGGQLHIIPNGIIEKISNYSSGNMRVMLEIQIAYEENVERAIGVLEAACQALAAEDPNIVEGPRVLGVQDLADSGVRLLLWAKTLPMEQWGVARKLRQRAKEQLDLAGIEIPYPRTVVIPITAKARKSKDERPEKEGL